MASRKYKSELEAQQADDAPALGSLPDGSMNVVTEDYDDGDWLMSDDDEKVVAKDATPRTLYVRRDLLNADEVLQHYADQLGPNASALMDAEKLHVTIAYSRAPVDWIKVGEGYPSQSAEDGTLRVSPGGARLHERLGKDGARDAVVLQFTSSALTWRWREMCEAGASWDFEDYQPHVTIAWDAAQVIDEKLLQPYRGALEFGPEIFEEIDEDWKAKSGIQE